MVTRKINDFLNPVPEKLSLWDRLFNRYRTIPIEEGHESWNDFYPLLNMKTKYIREYVLYQKIDRLTGSWEIKKVYSK